MSERFDTASLVAEQARRAPERTALIAPSSGRAWERLSYRELAQRIERNAAALAGSGLRRGDRTLVLARPGLDWAALVFGLFRLGAVPVLIDPAMGRRGLLACVQRLRPRGFVGNSAASALKLAYPATFSSVEVALTAGALPIAGKTLAAALREAPSELPESEVAAGNESGDEAAVLFTSGSTGPAKGVVYTHAMFRAQVAALRELYDMREGEVDVACFAPFALFGPALGLTTVLPRIDFSHPARCDPAEIVRAIDEHHAVQSFGSPAVWSRVAPWCREQGRTLGSLRRLMIAGAPVGIGLLEECLALLPPEGDVHTPYGATEALPVASAGAREILAQLRGPTGSGAGTCIGRAAPFVEARVIRCSDEPIEAWSQELEVAPGEPGELVVRGPQVTREYAGEPGATAAAKIRDGATFWHRMGDLVRIDSEGRIWFLGRKMHRLETERGPRFPIPIENVFRGHRAVQRCALVGVGPRGRERAVLVVELAADLVSGGAEQLIELERELLHFGQRVPACAEVERVLFHAALPVDLRHNAKIDRLALKRWAEEQLA